MAITKINTLALMVVALAASGCMRMGEENTYPVYRGNYGSVPPQEVIQSELPPPGGASNMMTAPNENYISSTNASLTNGAAIMPAAISGVWRASVNGMTCQIATPQTKFGNFYRAGPLHCPAALGAIRSWAIVNNNQLVFYDANGGSVATLYSNGSGFNGQTATGSPVTLSR